jgi:hypothetical protein
MVAATLPTCRRRSLAPVPAYTFIEFGARAPVVNMGSSLQQAVGKSVKSTKQRKVEMPDSKDIHGIKIL